MLSLKCGTVLKVIQMNLQNRNRLVNIEHKLTVTTGETWNGGTNQEPGINIYTLLYVRQVTNKDLLWSTGTSTQYSVITNKRKNLKSNDDMHV